MHIEAGATHATEACAEEKIFTSNKSGTNVSPLTHGTKGPGHDQNLNARTLFRSKGSVIQEDLLLKPFYHKWPGSKALQLKPSHTNPPC